MISQVLTEPGVFTKVESDVPVAGDGEIILEMAAVTICGSDVRIFTGEKTGSVVWPVIIGHEITGRVYEVGEHAGGDFSVGDLCAVVPWVSCGECSFCRTGFTNLCPKLRIFGYQIPGGLAEYIRIPKEAIAGGNLVSLPQGMDPAMGALAEPLACVLNGHLRCEISIGDAVLILGAGPIGMLHARLALLAGASSVIVSEPNPERAASMLKLGATHIIDPVKEDLISRVMDITGSEGVDVSIICIGIASLVDVATAATRPGGVVNLFAGFGGTGGGEVNLNIPHYKQLALLGNAGSTVYLYRRAVQLIATGAVDVAGMVTHRFPLSKAPEAIAAAASGQGIKIAIVPDRDFSD